MIKIIAYFNGTKILYGFIYSPYQTWTPTQTLEKTGYPISNLWKNQTQDTWRKQTQGKNMKKSNSKYQTIVKQKTEPVFCRLVTHNKRIDASHTCISTSANSLRQQANELCMLMGCSSLRKMCSYPSFAIIKSTTEKNIKFTSQSRKISGQSNIHSRVFFSRLSEEFLARYYFTA